MSRDLDEQRTQTELVGDGADWLREAMHAALVDVHTALPGIVQSYDEDKQTCSVVPAIKRVFVKTGPVALRECLDVPVVFPGGALTFEVASGDECLLIFAERCIDRWYAAGGVQEPDEFRMHDLSDGFAIIGPNSQARLLAEIGSGTELRTRDGSNRVALRDGKVLLGTNSKGGDELQPMLNGVVVAKGIDPFTKMTYYALGATSQNVLAKL